MLFRLRYMTEVLIGLDPSQDGPCANSLAEVTFGTAKTDPWDRDFLMTCTPGGPRFRSLGRDGQEGTEDDILGWETLGPRKDACSAACEQGQRCGSPAGDRCLKECGAATAISTQFAFGTCSLLSDCELVSACLAEALACVKESECLLHLMSSDCQAFARVAAKKVRATPGESSLIRAACEDYTSGAMYAELACIEESSTAEEAGLCVMTVNRSWVEPFAGRQMN